MRDVIFVENESIVEFAKSRRLGCIAVRVINVILGSGIADGSTALRIERGIVGQQPHAHVRIIVVTVEWSADGLAGKWVER